MKKIKEITNSIGRDENASPEMIKELNELNVIFQPLKPFMYGFEKIQLNNDEIAFIPVQHKYAEAVLIPELLPAGSKLRNIAYWMQDNQVDLIASTKCVKVGNFGAVDISESTTESLPNILNKGYVHEFNYQNYKLQTNVPEHINASNLFATQIRKHALKNINRI